MDQRADVSRGAVSADAWDEAYRRIDAYLDALGVRRAMLRHRRARQVMHKAIRAPGLDPEATPVAAAMAQLRNDTIDWMRCAVSMPQIADREAFLQTRLTFLLADVPDRWDALFLTSKPLPEPLAAALRENLRLVPGFRPGRMDVQLINLGLVPHLAEAALYGLERTPLLRLIVVWGSFISFFGLLFYLTR